MPMKLEDLKAAAQSTYGDLDYELEDGTIVSLRNSMRMTSKERAEFASIEDKLIERAREDDTVQVWEAYRDALKHAASDKRAFNKMSKELGENAAAWELMMLEYRKAVTPGKALS